MSAATTDKTELIELELEGMSCASCASRIERKLNALEGASATVNYASEQAYVHYDPARLGVEDLVAAVKSAGYDAHARGSEQAGERELSGSGYGARLAIAVALGVPVLLVAMISSLQFAGWEWLALALATPVVFWAGWPFHRAAALNLRHAGATMDTLVSLGTLSAWGWSAAVLVLGLDAPSYFEAAAVITALVLLGRYLEARAKRRSGDAIRSLLELSAKEATVLRDGKEARISARELRVGDLLVIRPGEKIATDGVVEDGASAVDQSFLTGEAVPVEVGAGDVVVGGAINSYGRLLVRATKVGSETALAQIGRLVEEAQAGKAPAQRLADRISAVFVPVVIAISLATLAFWLLYGAGAGSAFTAAVAVLVIACPCALGLATPAALMVGLGRGAQLGVLIRGPEVLERTRRITTVVLDKTGTVTEGRMSVSGIVTGTGVSEPTLIRLVGAAETSSEHPIARALVDYARARDVSLPQIERFGSSAGLGVEAQVEGHAVVVGRPVFLRERGLRLPDEFEARVAELEAEGMTVVAAGWDGVVRGLVSLRDATKPSSAAAIRSFEHLGLEPFLLSGDNQRTVESVARELGIERARSGVLPGEKAAVIRELQAAGEVVAMVGDGINDAPALAQADLGLALGSGTDVALEAGDVTLTSPDLRAVSDAVSLARRTLGTIKGNLFWAFAYNVAAIPIAAAGLLNPIIAAAAMSASSLLVVGNSLRLRRFASLRPETSLGSEL
ncbi:MAG TPA: heavy metal translocating P-type ATPase [Gaiellaceae bacterium]